MAVPAETPSAVPRGDLVAHADQRVVMPNVPWSHYQAVLAVRGENAGPRMSYLDGELELMTLSRDHERITSYIGCLIEAYALERNIDLSPYGSWTLMSEPDAGGAEPDECYIIGSDQSRDKPDLVIEVVWTSGGIDKLEIYRRLGVAEVWFWKEDQFAIHLLRDGRYQLSAKSAVFPELDLTLLLSFMDRPTAMQAVRAFRDALRANG
jgi:Uma2 family endonuclease